MVSSPVKLACVRNKNLDFWKDCYCQLQRIRKNTFRQARSVTKVIRRNTQVLNKQKVCISVSDRHLPNSPGYKKGRRHSRIIFARFCFITAFNKNSFSFSVALIPDLEVLTLIGYLINSRKPAKTIIPHNLLQCN